jgi:hypothetical protein
MRKLLLWIAILCAVTLTAAADPSSLGYSAETVVLGPGPDACAAGVLVANHNGTFENGYAWRTGGEAPPYYGAFGEGYDLGAGTVYCGAYWLSTLPGYFFGQTADCYVWEGGAGSAPGAVLGVVTGVQFDAIPVWPEIGQFDVDLNIAVSGPFTVGYWGNWPGTLNAWFCAADTDGPGGAPWTCIAPEIGYPTGWSDPSIVWGATQSMGCAAYFEQATPVEAETWGTLKSLFR